MAGDIEYSYLYSISLLFIVEQDRTVAGIMNKKRLVLLSFFKRDRHFMSIIIIG